MAFITAAREFLNDPGELAGDKNLDIMSDTVSFLLGNAVSLKHAKSTDTIVRFLNDQGYEINRHEWEIDVLGKLREEGVFIASNKSKGMYIIESEEEAEKFYFQYATRVATENNRLGWLRTLIDTARWERIHNKPRRKLTKS
jgi:hypothetical protein